MGEGGWGGEGVKITDFGLAKFVGSDAVSLSTPGGILGTPSYMPPEQARGSREVGPAADVYALGAVLYELLTGRPPFRAATPLGTLQQVVGAEPVPPRQLQPHLPHDLDTICLKCLHKDPARRYASALDLADDLRRFQAGEPIRARPVGVWEQGVRWVKRRPAAAALVGVCVLAVLGVLGVSLGYNRQLERALATTRQEKERADVNLLHSLALLQKSVVRDTRRDPREWMGPKRQQQLKEALAGYEGLREVNSNRPRVRQLMGQAHQQLALLQHLLGNREAAEESLGQARTIQQRLREEFPEELSYQHDLVNTLNTLGNVHRYAGRPAEALAAYTLAVQLDERLSGPTSKRDMRESLARAHHNLGNLLGRDRARRAEARTHYERALELHEQLSRENGDSVVYRQNLNQIRHRLADFVMDIDPRRGEAMVRQALADQEQLCRRPGIDPQYRHNLARQVHVLGEWLDRRGRHAEALAALEKAAGIQSDLVEKYRWVPKYRRMLARHHTRRGDVLLYRITPRAPEKAAAAYREALGILEELARRQPGCAELRGNCGWAHEKLAQALLRCAPTARSEACLHLEKAIRYLGEAVKRKPDTGAFRKVLGDAQKALARTQAGHASRLVAAVE